MAKNFNAEIPEFCIQISIFNALFEITERNLIAFDFADNRIKSINEIFKNFNAKSAKRYAKSAKNIKTLRALRYPLWALR